MDGLGTEHVDGLVQGVTSMKNLTPEQAEDCLRAVLFARALRGDPVTLIFVAAGSSWFKIMHGAQFPRACAAYGRSWITGAVGAGNTSRSSNDHQMSSSKVGPKEAQLREMRERAFDDRKKVKPKQKTTTKKGRKKK